MDIGLGEKGRIIFGLPTERAGYMLPRVIPLYKKMFPQVEVQIYEAMSDDLLSALLKDEINFYIIPRDLKDLPSGLQTECIYRENLYLIAAPGVVKEEDLADPIHNIVRDAFLRSQPFIPIKKDMPFAKKRMKFSEKRKYPPWFPWMFPVVFLLFSLPIPALESP